MNSKNTWFTKTVIASVMSAGLFLSGCELSEQSQTANFTTEQTQPSLLPISAIYSENTIGNIQLSKDGTMISFIKESNGASNLYVVPVDKSLAEAVVVTQFPDGIDSYFWSSRVGEVIISKDHEGNENYQIYSVKIDKDLSILPTVTRLTSKDDVSYRFPRQVLEQPDTLTVFANHNNKGQLDIFHLNIDSKALTQVYENKIHLRETVIDDQGQVTLGVKMSPDNSLGLYSKVGSDFKLILTTEPGSAMSPIYLDEEKEIAYISGAMDDFDKQSLLKVDINSGKISLLHSDPKNYADVNDVIFDKSGNPYLISYYGGRLDNYPMTSEAKAIYAKITANFVGEDVDIEVRDIDFARQHWDLSVTYSNQPAKRFVYQAHSDTLVDLLNKKPDIEPSTLGERKSVTYTARDGVEIQAYLTLPKMVQKKMPTIVIVHGGPWARDYWAYDGHVFNKAAHFFASRGYAVLQPNFRGSTGFGKHFINIAEKNWGRGAMQHDITDGVDYLVKQGIADKDNVGIMGASYGGYAALSGLTFTPDVFKAGISYVGPSSLITLMESFPDYYRPYLGNWFTGVGDPLIEADRVDMAYRSPINYVDNIKAPLMLLQGANDPRVTQKESDNIARVMYKKGLPVEYYLAKDEGHGFRKKTNGQASILAMEAFFSKHLGGAQSKIEDEEIAEHLSSLQIDISKL